MKNYINLMIKQVKKMLKRVQHDKRLVQHDKLGQDGKLNTLPLESEQKSSSTNASIHPSFKPSQRAAFTLAEILIALGIVGVLAAILMPIIHHIIPDKDAMMAKRAYYSASSVVSELINDGGCYPDKSNSSGADKRTGFDDGFGYANCAWGRDIAKDTIEHEGNAVRKFATLFMNELGYVPDGGMSELAASTSYTSKDGLSWTFIQGGTPTTVTKEVFNENKCTVDITEEIDGMTFPTSPCPSSCTTTSDSTNSTNTYLDNTCYTNCKKPTTTSYVDSSCFSYCKQPHQCNPHQGKCIRNCNYTATQTNNCLTTCCNDKGYREVYNGMCSGAYDGSDVNNWGPGTEALNECVAACAPVYQTEYDSCSNSDSECNTQCTKSKTTTKTDAECTSECTKTKTETTPGTTTTDQTCCNNAKASELNSKRQSAKSSATGCCSADSKSEKTACCSSLASTSATLSSACQSAVNGAYSTTQVEEYGSSNFMSIKVDVNGANEGANCSVKTCESGKTPDTFTMFINLDGKIKINPEDTWAAEAVKANKKVSK